MDFDLDDKDRTFISHSPTWDDAEPELKKQRLCVGDSDGSSGGDSDGSSGENNSDGSGSCNSGGSSGLSTVFIGNEQDDVYFEKCKYVLDPEDYENWTQERKRQYGRYNHQLDISNGYYLDFIPAIYGRYGIRAIDLTGEDYLGRFFPRLMRCIEVALKNKRFVYEEELELVGIVRANYDVGYGYVYWITMDVRDKGSGEIKTCICKVHYGVKGGAEDDMIVEDFKFIPSNFKYMQETSLKL
ncbi:unnamed protein product [Cuscuta campestris]|uniref:Cystatin domain-containing protein n=1 Tax=Cuscuta campestris TaxID=132261 RepID=A0A484LG38_9ASTE|nr:unnamed protein product [Cuscuta campestris]